LAASSFPHIAFKGINPRGERHSGSLEQFVAFLTERRIARAKDAAPGFSATAYRQHYEVETYSEISKKTIRFTVDAPAAYRSNAGVESLSALVLDLDHAEPDWARLESSGNLIVTWQTWSHTSADPHWRLVAPVAAPIAVDEWPSAFRLGLELFEPRSDTSCADPAHLFWLPAGPPEKDIDIRVIEGAPWSRARALVRKHGRDAAYATPNCGIQLIRSASCAAQPSASLSPTERVARAGGLGLDVGRRPGQCQRHHGVVVLAGRRAVAQHARRQPLHLVRLQLARLDRVVE
jgi:hypothetical protein